MRVAIMQPYFLPYTGYFRLFARSDLFILYDCVQFPRRGWVHRNRFSSDRGMLDWLTLPLAKAAQDVRIQDLQFRPSAQADFLLQLQRFPQLQAASAWQEALLQFHLPPVDYLEELLKCVCNSLELPFQIQRSSTFQLDPTLKGSERILKLCQEVGATQYINAPGGRDLYEAEAFAQQGITLQFLPEYQGPGVSILERLLTEPAAGIRADIVG